MCLPILGDRVFNGSDLCDFGAQAICARKYRMNVLGMAVISSTSARKIVNLCLQLSGDRVSNGTDLFNFGSLMRVNTV